MAAPERPLAAPHSSSDTARPRARAAARTPRPTLALVAALVFVLTGCASPVLTMVPDARASDGAWAAAPDPWQLLMDAAPGLQPRAAAFEQAAPAISTPAPGITITLASPTIAEPQAPPPITMVPTSPGASAPTQTAPDEAPTPTWSTTNVGLSFEASDLADPRWEPGASTLDTLIGELGSPSLRFGGNSVDRRVWFTSTNEPAPAWADTTLTPADFQRLGRLAEHVDATVTIALDLGHNDAERAADMAAAAHDALGDRLVAVSIGNEPNGFFLSSQPQYAIRDGSWGPASYVAQLHTYEQAIHARVPGLPIAGPGAFDAPWWRAFIEADLPNTAALGQHWYPLWSCPGRQGTTDAAAEPTAANLVSPTTHDRAASVIGMGMSTATAAGLPLWMEETGPTSCAGGTDSSRTHAQALWTVDYTLHAAELGVQRLNFHSMLNGCSGGAPMSVVCDRGGFDAQSPDVAGQANYLAVLFASWVREGSFVPVQVTGSDHVFAYAVRDARGTDLVIVNMGDPEREGAAPLTLQLPAGAAISEAAQLSGHAFAAANDSTLVPPAPATGASIATLNPGTATLIRFEPSE